MELRNEAWAEEVIRRKRIVNGWGKKSKKKDRVGDEGRRKGLAELRERKKSARNQIKSKEQ